MKQNLFNFRHSPKEFQTQGILSRVSRECRKSVGRLSTLLFLIFLGLGFSTQAWAWTINNAKIYYDPTAAGWGSGDCSYIQVFFDKSDGHAGIGMTHISNTNLWYWSGSWGDGNVSYLRFATTKNNNWGWTGNQSSWDHLKNDSYCCGVDGGYGCHVDNASTLFSSTGTSKGASITKTDLSSYSALNKSQTVNQTLSTNGGTSYSTSTLSLATVTVSSYAITGNGTSGEKSGTIAVGSSSASCDAALTATVTYSVSNVSTGYTFVGWYDGSTQKSTSTTYSYTATEAKTITARFKAKQYTISYQDQGGNTYSGNNLSSLPTTHTYGTATELVAGTRAGYNFDGWFEKSDCTGTAVTTIGATAKTGNFTLYAKWTSAAVYYSWAYGVHTSGLGTVASNVAAGESVLGGTSITLTATPNTGCVVEGWYSDAACQNVISAAGTGTEYTFTLSANTVVYVKFKEKTFAVTVEKGTGIDAVTGGGASVGQITGTAITATVKTGYTWSTWTGGTGTFEGGATTQNTTFKPTAASTITATATEKTVTLTPTVNDANMGTVSAAGSVGIATGLQLTATKKTGYKFDHWVLSSNLNIQDSKTVNDNPITVKTNGDGAAATAQAVFVADLSTGVTLRGTFNSFGDTDEFQRTSVGSNTATCTKTLDAKKTYCFKVKDNSDWYGNNGVITSSVSNWTFKTSDGNCYFNTAIGGDYVFTYDLSTHKVSIAYPAESHPSANYIYCLNSASWSVVNAHIYGGTEVEGKTGLTTWPGQTISATVTIDGTSYYYAAMGDRTTMNWANSDGTKKSADLTVSDGLSKYYKNDATGWKDFEFTLTLDKNSGSANGSARVKWMAGNTVGSKLDETPTKTGYKISKFTEDQAGNTQVMSAGGSAFQANTTYTDGNKKWNYPQSVTLYTQWTANDYVVTLDYNNGSGTTIQKNVTYDDDKNLTQITSNPLPTKTGQDFTGYWTKNDGTGTQLVDNTGYFLNEVTGYIKAGRLWGYADNLTIYAGWSNQTYSISYLDQGGVKFSGDWGSVVHPTTHTYNTATTLVDAPNKTGYTFGGWYTTSTCTGDAVTTLGATAYTANITLYAKWNPTTTEITLYRNDGTSGSKTLVATYDAELDNSQMAAADSTRTGYKFGGYKATTSGSSADIVKGKVTGDGYEFPNSGSYGVDKKWKNTSATLDAYGYWTANQYLVSFNQHDPTTAGDAEKQVTYDASVSNINVPAKTGQIFSGYYTEADGAGVEVFTAAGALVANASGYTTNGKWTYAGNVTLHAYWATPQDQTVNFGITNGGALDGSLGTITAKVDGTAISYGDKVASGKTVVFEYTPAKGTVITGINGAKLSDWYNGVVIASSTSYGVSTNSFSQTVSASTINAYAYAQALEYTVATAVSPAEKGTVTSNNNFRCGPNLNTQLTANPIKGYHFVKWSVDVAGKVQFGNNDSTISPMNVAVKEAGRTVTATFAETMHEVTVNGGTPMIVSAGMYTPGTATAATAEMGKHFVDWTIPTGITLVGCQTTDEQITFTATADGLSVTANYAFTDYTVTMIAGVGGSISKPIAVSAGSQANFTTAHFGVPFKIQADTTVGYRFVSWTSSKTGEKDDISFTTQHATNANSPIRKAGDSDASLSVDPQHVDSGYARLDVTHNATLTASFAEIKVKIVPTVNTVGEEQSYTATASVDSIGITTTSELHASKPGKLYRFIGWDLSDNLVVTSGNKTQDTIITVRTNGDGQAVTAEAQYEEIPKVTLYFVNVPDWEDVYAYVYDANDQHYVAWPGTKLSKETKQINLKDVYSYTFPETYTKIIFNNNSGSQILSAKETWSASTPYYYDGAWYAKADLPKYAIIGEFCDWKFASALPFDVEDMTVTVPSLDKDGIKICFDATDWTEGKIYGAYDADYTLNVGSHYDMYKSNSSKNFIFAQDYTNARFQLSNGSDGKLRLTFVGIQDPEHTVNFIAGDHGSIEPVGENTVTEQVGRTVTATPDSHFYFSGWDKSTGVTTTSESASTTVKATQDGTLTANFDAKWKLCGSFTNWKTNAIPFVTYDGSNTSVQVELTAGSHTFKIWHKTNDDEEWCGKQSTTINRGNAESGVTMEVGSGDSYNITLTTDKAGQYAFNLNVDTKHLSVTFPPEDPNLSITKTAGADFVGQKWVLTPTTNVKTAVTVCYNVDARPDGSTATIEVDDKNIGTFIPDKVGNYTFSATLHEGDCSTAAIATASPIYCSANTNNYNIYIGYAGASVQSIPYNDGYSIELQAGKEYDLKVVDRTGGGEYWYGNTGTMTATNHTGWTFSHDVEDNAALATTVAGTYTFDFDIATKKLTAHYPALAKEMYASSVKSKDQSVMIQAYYWTHGKDAQGHDNDSELNLGYGDMKWNSLDAMASEIAANFDLVWLAPSQSTADWTGFLPVNYSDQNNRAWATSGTGATEIKQLISDLHAGGAKVIADIVLNHSNASRMRDEKWEGNPDKYTFFETMNFGQYGSFTPDYKWVTRYDETFLPNGDKNGSPYLDKGMAEYVDQQYANAHSISFSGYNFEGMYEDEYTHSVWKGMQSGTIGQRGANFERNVSWSRGENDFWLSRDWAHKKREVREMSRAYLTWMRQEIGYDGFRYDFMKGFHCSHIDDYNKASGAEFSVMECFDGGLGNELGVLDDAHYNTHVFDFPTKFVIREAIGDNKLPKLKTNENKVIFYPEYQKNAIVFAENHDSFREDYNSLTRTSNPTLEQLQGSQYASKILQANAYILAMPGIPCVFYPHWVAYKEPINKMIAARHAAGVHSESAVEDWVEKGIDGSWTVFENGTNWYSARTKGEHGYVLIKLGVDGYAETGGDDPDGHPFVPVYRHHDYGVAFFYTSGDPDLVPTLTCNKQSQEFVDSITGITFETWGATYNVTYSIRYTTDGTDPTMSSNEYSSALRFGETTTLKVVAFNSTKPTVHSPVMELTFTKVDDKFTITKSAEAATGKTVTFTAVPQSGHPEYYSYTFQMMEPGNKNFKTIATNETGIASYTFPGGGVFTLKMTAVNKSDKKEYVVTQSINSSATHYYIRHPFKDGSSWSTAEMTDLGDGTFMYFSTGASYAGEESGVSGGQGSGGGSAGGASTGIESLIWWNAGANVGTTGKDTDPYFHHVGSTKDTVIQDPSHLKPEVVTPKVNDSLRVVWVYNSWNNELKVLNPNDSSYRFKIQTEANTYYSNTITATGAQVSFYCTTTSTITLQVFGGEMMEWVNMCDVARPTEITANGVYTATATITKATASAMASASLDGVAAYTGDYYIYSNNTSFDPANIDNVTAPRKFNGTMIKFEKLAGEFYDHYWVQWIKAGESGGSATYKINTYATVGNKINTSLAATMPEYFLPDYVEGSHEGASVRYGYDPSTNYFGRAHLDGSTANRMLVGYGVNIKDTTGTKELTTAENGQKFSDVADYVYDVDVKGNYDNETATDIRLAAQFNGAFAYLLSPDGTDQLDAYRRMAEVGNTLPEPAKFHVLYDYKTNRIVTGWDPKGEEITDSIAVPNLYASRANDTFNSEFSISTGKVVVVDQMTTEFNLTKEFWNSWEDSETGSGYKTLFFWFSLPYPCKVNQIYGFEGTYGISNTNVTTSWEIQSYRGELRDQGKAGNSPWKRPKYATYTMEANAGYVLAIRVKEADFKTITIDDKTISLVRFFFPSAGQVTLNPSAEVTLEEYATNKDTIQRDWHVMGVPVMKSGRAYENSNDSTDFEYVYRWTWAGGGRWYEPIKIHDTSVGQHFNFQAGHAYMVQGHGKLTWNYADQEGKLIDAPKRATALTNKDFRIDLNFDGEQQDKTYVLYRKNGTRDYEIGRDLEKIENAGRSMIYSELDSKLASICLSDEDDTTIPLTIVANESGEYTISIPAKVAGVEPVLYDYNGDVTETPLNYNSYKVELSEGTYKNRFFLGIKTTPFTPTNVDNAGADANGERAYKYVDQEGNLYILRDGKLYNATGAVVE